MTRLFPLMLLLGCAHFASMRASRDRAALEEAVRGYWDAVRWSDPARGAEWLRDPKDKLALGRLLNEPRYRVSDVTIVQLALGEEPEKDAPQEATALVRLEVADAVTYRGETVLVEQHWVEQTKAWYVDTGKSPLGKDRAWTVAAPAEP